MTSSSDAGWTPLDPAAVRSNVLALPVPERGDGGWLPALHTPEQAREATALEAACAQAYRRGRADAQREEGERAEERCRSALRAVAAAAERLEAIVGEFARDRERDVFALSIAVARHVVQHELTIDPLRVGELVQRALELLPLDHTLEVRLHPDDLRTLGNAVDGILPAVRNVHLQWASDPSVEQGGFVIESPQRIVDGRPDVALRALYERLDHD